MKHKVLVVDDELGARTLIEIMLDRAGFEVLKARDAATALECLDADTPDLIILDVLMPEVDGIALCEIIRSREDTHETPVLILSALRDAESVIRGIEAGANDYLPKPILHNDLIAKVRGMLGLNITGH